MRPTSDLAPGSVLAGYRIEAMVGRGGMGVVYRATQLALERAVALKVVAPGLAHDPAFRERFGREAKLAASVEHPHVLPVYEAGEQDGVLFLSMRFVEGEDLASFLRREGSLAPARAAALVAQVAEALDAAHARGLVHRDVKPQNVLVEAREGREHAFLCDFGLSKRALSASTLTQAGGFVGTLDYASPEQVRGEETGRGADVYALGCVLYHCLTGSVPFPHPDELAKLWAHLHEPVPAPGTHGQELASFDTVVARAMAKDPKDRHASAGELAEDALAAAAAVPLAPATPSPPPEPEEEALTRKVVSLLHAGLVEVSDAGARLDVEAARRVARRFLDASFQAIERHGGVAQAVVGDAALGIFGVPEVHENDALRAVRAALDLGSAVETLGRELESHRGVRVELRAGVSTGEVVAEGTVGRLVTGDAVSLAADLAAAALPSAVLVGETTRRLVRDAVALEPADPVARQGAEAARAWRVAGLRDEAEGSRAEAPLVGRDAELSQLRHALERAARERSVHLFTILGPPGIGKSRLAHELLTEARSASTVLVGRCLPYGEGITFWPLAEIVRQAFGDDPIGGIERLFDGDGDGDLVAARIGGTVGMGAAGGTTEETFWATRRLFEELACERPLVLLFEDIHWAEPTFLDLLEHVADWTRDAPIFLLCLARPDLLDERPLWAGGKLNATSILLEPLTEDDAEALIDALLGEATLEPATRVRVREAAEGNPLFVEQILAMLAEDGARAGPFDIPPTIDALLAARLDRLGPSERAVIERASVVGREFWVGAVDALVPTELRGSIPGTLMTLVRKELVRRGRSSLPGEDAFRFRHILIRDAAYRTISKELRSRLHETFAGWLERKAGERSAEYEEILGYHLEQAYLYEAELGPLDPRGLALADRAASLLAGAGHRAFVRGDMASAVNLLGRAAALPFEAPPGLGLELAEALQAVGDLTWAEALLDEAAEAPEPTVRAHATLDRLFLRALVDPAFSTEDLRRAAEESFPVFEEQGDERGLAKAWRAVAEVHLTACRWGESAGVLERALEHAERAGEEKEVASTLTVLANALYYGPTPVPEALRRCAEILERAHGHRIVEANIVCYLAGLNAMEGRFDEARALYRRGRALFEELGHRYGLASHRAVSGAVEMLAGNAAAAEAEFRAGYDIFEAMGEKGILSTLAALLAEAVHRQGRDAEAERLTAVSEEAATPDDAASQIAWRVTRAKVLARRGVLAAAERLAAEAVEIAGRTDFLAMHGDALLALAEILRLSGREAEASETAGRAGEFYEAKGDLADLERAAALV